ncbi:DUF7220 family protein [Roseivirga sp.]|uniref:DUF7220 family protein n=1 Tax=Roseivirga sp. TaxID=1964215 RepID=UPI003B8E8A7E
MQTKKQSLKESLANVAIGFFITVVSLYLILPVLGMENHHQNNFALTAYLTILSIIRNYFLRRFFNSKQTQNKHDHPDRS